MVQCLSASTPRITVELSQNGTYLGESQLLADSGSTVDILSLQFARDKALTLTRVNPSHFSLTAANGGQLSVSFTTDIDIRLPGMKDFQPIRCLVSSDLQTQDIIVGWSLMLRWGLLQLSDFQTVQKNYSSLQL